MYTCHLSVGDYNENSTCTCFAVFMAEWRLCIQLTAGQSVVIMTKLHVEVFPSMYTGGVGYTHISSLGS